MRTHHPATKTALWRSVIPTLRGSPSYVKKHAQKLIKELYEGGSDCTKLSLIARNVSPTRLTDDNPVWMMHKYICRKNNLPLLSWRYN